MTPPKTYGLIGYPVKHSLSPIIHNSAFKALDIDAEYRLFEIPPENLEDFLLKDIEVKDITGKSVWTADILGFNITIPHKVRAKEILEKRFPPPPSEEIFHNVTVSGAINTVKREGGGYYNTDVVGFRQALRNDLKFETKNKNILLIGCGGAGRAVVAATAWEDLHTNKIYIYESNEQTVKSAKEYFFEKLSSRFSFLKVKLEFISDEQLAEVIKRCHLLVNATPVGMKEGDGPVIDKNLLRKDLFVYDLIYNRKTQLIKDAELLGCIAKDGLGMLLYQGARSFEIWMDRPAPIDIMQQALKEAVGKL